MRSTNEDIANLIKTGDHFKVSVLGFSAIEEALEQLIAESLPKQHKVELRRLSAAFKVDLAIGLGVFDKELKGLTLKLSKIRNSYAHEFNTDAELFKSSELISAMPKSMRDSASQQKKSEAGLDVLCFAVLMMYINLTSRITWFRQKRRERIEFAAHTRALLEETSSPVVREETEYYKQYCKELDERVSRRKEQILSELGSSET